MAQSCVWGWFGKEQECRALRPPHVFPKGPPILYPEQGQADSIEPMSAAGQLAGLAKPALTPGRRSHPNVL